MRVRRFKSYIAAFIDPEGVTRQYAFMARSRRCAEHEARELAARWSYTLTGVKLDRRVEAKRRRLLVVAGFTFAVSGFTITAMMMIGLSLEGAL